MILVSVLSRCQNLIWRTLTVTKTRRAVFIRSLWEYLLFYLLEVKQKKQKKMDQPKHKQKVSKTVEGLHDAKKESSSLETGLCEAVAVNRKRRKAEKKQKSLTELDVSTEAALSNATAMTNDSAAIATAGSPHVKRLPATSDCNSGVVRVIEKSKHKRVQRTDNIEESLHLDVGIGSCQW